VCCPMGGRRNTCGDMSAIASAALHMVRTSQSWLAAEFRRGLYFDFE
jgi:hypothetical protein